MLWGAVDDPENDMSFYNAIKSMVQSGTNITYVLGFNEPDGCSNGGSCVPADTAALMWKKQMEPIKRDFGIKIGGPAVTSAPTGFNWLQNWYTQCAILEQAANPKSNGSCEVDFLPMHYYGNFEGMAGHIGQVNGTYPNATSLWMTEFALPDSSLDDSISFYNQATDYLDRLPYIGRYSYFGAFRSDVSNVSLQRKVFPDCH